MTVSAPARRRSGTIGFDEFLAFLEMRPKEQRWHLIENIAVMLAPPTLAPRRIAFILLFNRGLTEQRRGLTGLYRGTPLRPQQRRGD